MCVCLYTREIKGRHGCVCVSGIITLPSYVKSRVSMGVCMYICVSGIITLPSTATCVCMYENIAECLQLHKAVTLLLIMK